MKFLCLNWIWKCLVSDCGCYKPGTVGGSRVCGTDIGDCVCKPFVSQRQCDQCLDGTYNLQDYNVFGCQGRWNLRAYFVFLMWGFPFLPQINSIMGTEKCFPRWNFLFWDLLVTLLKIKFWCPLSLHLRNKISSFFSPDCECDNGGALDHICNKDSGQCSCRPRVQGRMCDKSVPSNFHSHFQDWK